MSDPTALGGSETTSKAKLPDEAAHVTELMVLSKEAFLHTCEQHPRAQQLLQRYAVRQIHRLSKIRVRRLHLHQVNFKVDEEIDPSQLSYKESKKMELKKREPISRQKAKADLTIDVRHVTKSQFDKQAILYAKAMTSFIDDLQQIIDLRLYRIHK